MNYVFFSEHSRNLLFDNLADAKRRATRDNRWAGDEHPAVWAKGIVGKGKCPGTAILAAVKVKGKWENCNSWKKRK